MDGSIKGEEPVRISVGPMQGPGGMPGGPGAAPRYQFSNAGPHNSDYGDPPGIDFMKLFFGPIFVFVNRTKFHTKITYMKLT
jgi:hypothetical protein